MDEPSIVQKRMIFQKIFKKLTETQVYQTQTKLTAFNDLVLYCYIYLPELRDNFDLKSEQTFAKIKTNFPLFSINYYEMIERQDQIQKMRNLISLENVKTMETFLQYDDLCECELVFDQNGEVLLCSLEKCEDEAEENNETNYDEQ